MDEVMAHDLIHLYSSLQLRSPLYRKGRASVIQIGSDGISDRGMHLILEIARAIANAVVRSELAGEADRAEIGELSDMRGWLDKGGSLDNTLGGIGISDAARLNSRKGPALL